jgi:SAM-dependent methyltransferase
MPGISVAESVLGITDPTDTVLSMQQAHEVLTGERLDHAALQAELARCVRVVKAMGSLAAPDETVRLLAAEDVASLLEWGNLSAATTLSAWSMYQGYFNRYGQRTNGNATALMIGAATSVSSRSFTVLANEVYGASRACIVDIIGARDMTRHGDFVYGSGLHLPFQSESIDIVHTDKLFHLLKDPDNPERTNKQKTHQLLAEIGRVVVPGGQVIMQEHPTAVSADDTVPEIRQGLNRCATFIKDTLRHHGFDQTESEIPLISGREELRLLDPDRDFFSDPKVMQMGVTMVYARKRPSLGPIPLSGERRVIPLAGAMSNRLDT